MSDAASAPPRVLHLVTDPGRFGAQNFARDLHAELLRRGQPSELRALHPQPRTSQGAPADDLPVLGPSGYHPTALRALRAAAREADVVVAHGSTTLQACALGLLGSGIPFVYVTSGDPRTGPDGWARRLWTAAFLHCAAAVSAVSDGARQVLIQSCRLPAARVRTIPNGRATERFRPAGSEEERRCARELLGLPARGPLVAWIGSAAADKRFDLALDVLDRLPDVHLAVAGDCPLPDSQTDHTGRAHFLGRLADSAPLYRAADALLLTSDSEGVPGALIEGTLAGLPAVATDVGWVRDLVLDGVTGALVGPGDAAALAEALGKVLAGSARLGAAAREHTLARFDLAVVTDAWLLLLQQVASR
ncbi:glycosyltransferase family 4 protein [Kitasatospora sp. MAP5-34]|uniref:glycosyltransferase family 4 protein n=1 Tax=Kitasatospora sp. MAP5-34 TaxID=3035102 RepID=UPI0024744015|nr:glycosyltransferase family 4 protein [Kitasatospora sp. MAP5-34]MDH6579438.1 glycosyltransferase involved in cell wall biosynthesis [Kitasatospora sp. MAP5-34]